MAVPDLQDAFDHLQEENLDAAIATLERKIEELPAHLTAHVLLARTYEAKHRWTQALKTWENVRFLMPNSPVGQKGKARVLRQLDRDEEAEEAAPFYTEAPSQSPEPTPEDAAEPEEEDEGAPSTAPEAASELEQLRRRAEEEARRGGSRPERTEDAASSRADPSSTAPESDETPETRVGQLGNEDETLDRLIDELESAEIEPDPDVDDVPPPDLENDVDDIVSETLARIHEEQDEYRKAAQIYVKLASQEPDQAREYLEKAAEMREQAEAAAQQNNGS